MSPLYFQKARQRLQEAPALIETLHPLGQTGSKHLNAHSCPRPPDPPKHPQSLPGSDCKKRSFLDQLSWKPFTLSVKLVKDGPPVLRAVGVNAWCGEQGALDVVEMIQLSNFKVKGFRGLHGVQGGAGGGERLLLLSPKVEDTFDIFPEFVPERNGVRGEWGGWGQEVVVDDRFTFSPPVFTNIIVVSIDARTTLP